MEATIRNFVIAAAKVQVSRVLGVLLAMRKGVTINDTRTASRGFIE
jgi:hypothetical protein